MSNDEASSSDPSGIDEPKRASVEAELRRMWQTTRARLGKPIAIVFLRAVFERVSQRWPGANAIQVGPHGIAIRNTGDSAGFENDWNSRCESIAMAQDVVSEFVPQVVPSDHSTVATYPHFRALASCTNVIAEFHSVAVTLPLALEQIATVIPIASATFISRQDDRIDFAVFYFDEKTPVDFGKIEAYACDQMRLFVPDFVDPPAVRIAVVSLQPNERTQLRGVTIPLVFHDRCIGLFRVEPTREISIDDLDLLSAVAHQLARCIHRKETSTREWMSVISHDLRNPLSAILMNLALVERSRVPSPPDKEKHIRAIKRSAERMSQLIQNLVDGSHLDAGELGVDLRMQPIAPLLTDTGISLEPHAENRSVGLRVHLPSAQLAAPIDRDRIMQSLANMVVAAIRVADKGSEVEITAILAEKHIEIDITVENVSISVGTRPVGLTRAWWSEHQASLSTGIGLEVAKGIAQAHGGTLGVRSRTANELRFFLTIANATP